MIFFVLYKKYCFFFIKAELILQGLQKWGRWGHPHGPNNRLVAVLGHQLFDTHVLCFIAEKSK